MQEDEDDVENMWNRFKNVALKPSKEVLGEKSPYRGNKKRTPWWGEEVKRAVKFKMEQFRK